MNTHPHTRSSFVYFSLRRRRNCTPTSTRWQCIVPGVYNAATSSSLERTSVLIQNRGGMQDDGIRGRNGQGRRGWTRGGRDSGEWEGV
jgi:hypothetical protein